MKVIWSSLLTKLPYCYLKVWNWFSHLKKGRLSLATVLSFLRAKFTALRVEAFWRGDQSNLAGKA